MSLTEYRPLWKGSAHLLVEGKDLKMTNDTAETTCALPYDVPVAEANSRVSRCKNHHESAQRQLVISARSRQVLDVGIFASTTLLH